MRVAENLRDTANGTVLGRLGPGTPLTVVGRQGSWLRVDLEGWVWTPSLQRTDRDGFDLMVSAPDGENLRASPSGAVLGHLNYGALLHQLGSRPGWRHVKRQGWIWAASVTVTKPVEVAAARASPPPSGRPRTTEPADTSAATTPVGFVSAGSRGVAILTSAGGDTMAVSRPSVELRVLSRDGDWARVRLEGWAWLPRGDTAMSHSVAVDTTLTPAVLEKAPRAYLGRVVAWTLQFIGLEHAEKVRTDFFPGEPYLLTRFGGSGGSFVYVAVPPSWVHAAKGLQPLDRIFVTGRVRTGASTLTGAPIVDLLSMKRLPSGG